MKEEKEEQKRLPVDVPRKKGCRTSIVIELDNLRGIATIEWTV